MDPVMEANPYQPPVDEVPPLPLASESTSARLASRGSRFVAALVDSIAAAAVGFVFGLAVDALSPPSFWTTLIGAVGSFVSVCVIGAWFFRSGQSIGKRLANVRIVEHASGRTASALRIVGLRILPITLLLYLPGLAMTFSDASLRPDFLQLSTALYIAVLLLDSLLIFGVERRCLHDRIAGTKVVEVLQ
jgi:uncharacterized RDD family membrane protein YckC